MCLKKPLWPHIFSSSFVITWHSDEAWTTEAWKKNETKIAYYSIFDVYQQLSATCM